MNTVPTLKPRPEHQPSPENSTPPFVHQPTGDAVVDGYIPRTELGRKLLMLRRQYVLCGGQLLDGEALDETLRSRQGGVADA